MPENYEIVPWFNSCEWYKVCEELSSEKSNKQDALNLLEMWKARSPSLPSGIESTLSLLQVYMQDSKSNNNDVSSEQMLRLAYSSAIMRFVNHMLDDETAKGLSLYSAAKNAGVPDWIIELRHDVAHSHNIPSLTLLRHACSISLKWLQEHYWEHHKVQGIHDYCNDIDENKIAAMIYFCSCISICAYSKIKRIKDIPETKMQKAIINDANVLFCGSNDSSNIKTYTIESIINLMNTNAKKILKDSGSTYYVNMALIDDQSLILSLELLDYLSGEDFNYRHKLSKSHVLSFEVLLTFLHTHDLILDFILALIKITQTEDNSKRNKLAALWISEILAALIKSKTFLGRARKMNSVNAASNKKDLKQLYRHWFPSDKCDGLVLDLLKPVPKQLTDISFIQPIISSYSPYMTYFVKDLLNLVEPHLPKEVINKICTLAKLISTPENFPADLSSMKIYTTEDLNSENMILDENECSNKSGASESITELSSGIWKIASNHTDWRICPIGKSPQIGNLEEME